MLKITNNMLSLENNLNSEFKKNKLGQIYTPIPIVKFMINLSSKTKKHIVLEPSCGNGNFCYELEKKFIHIFSIELDPINIYKKATNCDFFSYDFKTQKFDLIIGNPPYVKYNQIISSTKEKLVKFNHILNGRSNLYMHFIYKSIQLLKNNGELIFIVPKDFVNSQAARKLNQFIFDNGTITNFYDLSDKKVFQYADIDVCIFKFVKNDFSRITNESKKFMCKEGILYFLESTKFKKFNDFFYVKVGGVSGLDQVFTHSSGNIHVVFSKTIETGLTKKMIKDVINEHLLNHKQILLKRKINNFNEKNWWKWGREFYLSNAPRIYVNVKTRKLNPFFLNSCNLYDGSILGIFPKFKNPNLPKIVDYFNSLNWQSLGLKNGNRFIFKASALEKVLLPHNFDIKNFIKNE